ncbi:hypothetical protein CROQUDRAFT_652320 [Cronartium quercuum f. sp. fusiforme G11]|uniref:Uncharacterized protein n=1 Tax=Cronartium quercuum f. sp. fusiforme G11 TaxID=708437 RepID=A0A9P6TH42_9BASI|nr:hypothetical protein CROQUDRAFT_652320 [Cronartium quercuum f. sp. fusiforme G11]
MTHRHRSESNSPVRSRDEIPDTNPPEWPNDPFPVEYRVSSHRIFPGTFQGEAYVFRARNVRAPTPFIYPPQERENVYYGWVQTPSFDPMEIISNLIHYIQNRIFVCVKSNCDCRNESVTRMTYSSQLIGREVRFWDRPRPCDYKPVDVILKGAPNYDCLNYETRRSGGVTVNPDESIENFDVYHGPVDHLLLENMTDYNARVLMQILKDFNRAEVSELIECYMISVYPEGGISVPSYESTHQESLNSYPAFLIKNAIDDTGPPYTPPPYSPPSPHVPAPIN